MKAGTGRVKAHGDCMGTGGNGMGDAGLAKEVRDHLPPMPQNPMQRAQAMLQATARKVGSERFCYFIMADADRPRATMLPRRRKPLMETSLEA